MMEIHASMRILSRRLAINNRRFRAVLRDEFDRFAVELNIAVTVASIGAGGDQNSITINSRVYPRLYGGLLRRNEDGKSSDLARQQAHRQKS